MLNLTIYCCSSRMESMIRGNAHPTPLIISQEDFWGIKSVTNYSNIQNLKLISIFSGA